MFDDYLIKAIKKLKPNVDYSFTDADYATIKWELSASEAPTQKQIDDEIKIIKADEIAKAKAKAAAKAALLERMGLSEDEAKLLLS